VANWVAGELMSLANEKGAELSTLSVTPQRLGKLLDRIVDGTVSGKAAKQVLFRMVEEGGEPDDVIERLGLKQISDAGALEAAVEKVIAANAKLVDDYRSGKEKAFNALVGQVMKATQGKANPSQVNEILKRRLAAAG
jgi:aspartyl-tRNA(Asn)/glutamyl-tRNA(Gln) amidotransferase subunit B